MEIENGPLRVIPVKLQRIKPLPPDTLVSFVTSWSVPKHPYTAFSYVYTDLYIPENGYQGWRKDFE